MTDSQPRDDREKNTKNSMKNGIFVSVTEKMP